MLMLSWITTGLIAGLGASQILNTNVRLRDLSLGIVGAILGGWLLRLFSAGELTDFSIYSMFVSTLGSLVFLVLHHLPAGPHLVQFYSHYKEKRTYHA